MAQLTSVTDSKLGTFVARLKVPADGWSAGTIWGIGLSGGGLLGVEFVGGDGEIDLELYNASASAILVVETATLNGRTDEFTLLLSWDLAAGTVRMYANDTNVAGTPSVGPTNDFVDWTQNNFTIGAFNNTGTPGSSKGKFCVGDFYLNTDEFIDFATEANRRKFVDASGNPVNLGADGSTPTGSQPAVFQSGATATWHTNLGYGGGLTEVGELTDCGAAQDITVGLATETDTALAVTRSKVKALGLAAETDTALGAAPSKALAAGLATETDTALAVTRSKALAAGLAAETDTALAVTVSSGVVVGLATETDTGLAVGAAKAKAVGLATETDTALAVTVSTGISVGLAAEVDTALAVLRAKRRDLGLASELGTALAVTALRAYLVGLAAETDTALEIGRSKVKAVGLAAETDTAFGVTVTGPVAILDTGLEWTVPEQRAHWLAPEQRAHWIAREDD